jgi:ferredoxin-NADP reductase
MTEPHLLFIAGGTGIAPLRSMLWEMLERQPDVHVGVLYSARSPEEFAYRDELSALAAQNRIELRLTTTREAGVHWSGGRGRIDAALIAEMLRGPETRTAICGPPSLITEAAAALRSAGIADERIVSETYGGA